jgi:hypothetical protein
MLMPKDFKVQRLSDEFGQYLLVIKCRVRSRAASVSEFAGAYLRVGCEARGFGEAIALFEVRKEKLPRSSDRNAKAARHAAGALRSGRRPWTWASRDPRFKRDVRWLLLWACLS